MADAPADLEIRLLRADDDPAPQLDLAERAFGAVPAAEREGRIRSLPGQMASGRILGVFAGRQPAASASYHDMRQWWCGRPVPMAGVAGVMVAPEYRSRGVGRRVMTALLDEIAARGYPLSALYPATMPLYRSLGWELAGARDTVVIPARSLRGLTPPDDLAPGDLAPGDLEPGGLRPADLEPGGLAPGAAPDPRPGPELRRAGPADADVVIAMLGRVHAAARDCGPLTRDPAMVAQWLADPGLYAYLAADGFLAYHWHHRNHDLFVECAEAVSAQTVRAFWTQVGSYASMAEKIYVRTSPASAIWWLTRERDPDIEHRARWMLRVVDAPAAIAARGFPPAVSLRVPLRVIDAARPANAGIWELTVAGGAGALTPARPAQAPGVLVLGARGLAALYAGTPVGTLQQAGLAVGGTPDGNAALDAAFAASTFMLDAF
jgi:predicted acetyltransferase